MKTFYHGTLESSLPDILREGLQHKPDQRWKITFARGLNNEEVHEPYVFVAAEESQAVSIAVQRVLYMRTKPGSLFFTGMFQAQVKNPDAPLDPKAKPAIIEVSLPDNWPISADDAGGLGFKTSRNIPPKYLKVVKSPLVAETMDAVEELYTTKPVEKGRSLSSQAADLEIQVQMKALFGIDIAA